MDDFETKEDRKKKQLKYGSIVYLNYLDLNGSIYYCYSEGVNVSRILLQPQSDFFKSTSKASGKPFLPKGFSRFCQNSQ
jgi:hypothetical protein